MFGSSCKQAVFTLGFCLLASLLYGAQIKDTLYINRGDLVLVDSVEMPYLAFNANSNFSGENKRLIYSLGDDLLLTIVNNDTVQHQFAIKGFPAFSTSIGAMDTSTTLINIDSLGAHIYFDPSTNESFSYLGMAGMIVVEDPNSTASNFYWNIKEHQLLYNIELTSGNLVDWSEYYPNYFTINGRSNPYINQDPFARVTGLVGDSIYIHMVNTGQSLHSMHFHGYHGEIVRSTRHPNHIGRSKDTFPIYSMEVVTILIVPNQPGEYPVHDHNLVAVSGGNIYPNGMFVTLLID